MNLWLGFGLNAQDIEQAYRDRGPYTHDHVGIDVKISITFYFSAIVRLERYTQHVRLHL